MNMKYDLVIVGVGGSSWTRAAVEAKKKME